MLNICGFFFLLVKATQEGKNQSVTQKKMIDLTRMMLRKIEKLKEEKLDLISLICEHKEEIGKQSMYSFDDLIRVV